MNTCTSCKRALRGRRQSKADYPNTVVLGAWGLCSTCFNREHKAGRLTAAIPTSKPRYDGPCKRCGVVTAQRRNPICIDCLDVLTAPEAKAWAA